MKYLDKFHKCEAFFFLSESLPVGHFRLSHHSFFSFFIWINFPFLFHWLYFWVLQMVVVSTFLWPLFLVLLFFLCCRLIFIHLIPFKPYILGGNFVCVYHWELRIQCVFFYMEWPVTDKFWEELYGWWPSICVEELGAKFIHYPIAQNYTIMCKFGNAHRAQCRLWRQCCVIDCSCCGISYLKSNGNLVAVQFSSFLFF